MGFIITINTNGTLLNEDVAKTLAENMPRRVNLTIYGSNNKTYERLCNNPNGFTQLMDAVKWLKKYDIPFRFQFSATPQNYEETMEIMQLVKELDSYIVPSYYMFPPARIENDKFDRLNPEQVADTWINGYCAQHNVSEENAAKQTLLKLKEDIPVYEEGLTCRGGRNGFWVNWKGELLPCGMFTKPNISLLQSEFADAWNILVKETKQLCMCPKCVTCKKSALCLRCAAASFTETGDVNGCPTYLCEVTDLMIKRLIKHLPYKEQEEYLKIIEM